MENDIAGNKDPVEVIHRDKMSVLLLEAENRPLANVRVFVASISSQFRKAVSGVRLLLKAEVAYDETVGLGPGWKIFLRLPSSDKNR